MSVKPAFIRLPHKAAAAIAYHFFPPTVGSASATPATAARKRLLVFCNGMVGPQASWMPAIQSLIPRLPSQSQPFGILTYDRYGQAMTTDRDPDDSKGDKDPKFGHDLNEVVRDLHELISAISTEHSLGSPELVLVGNSIGCAIARHYTATHPKSVAGILLLDSILANSDFHNDVFLDPDAPSWSSQQLPQGLTEEELRKTRENMFKIFSPTNPNGEGFDRRNMASILPKSDSPKLEGAGGNGPYLTVVGHDLKKFAKDSQERMGVPEAATNHYVQSVWEAYNEGMLKTSDKGTGKVIIAEGCGHLIQLDGPGLVAGYIHDILTAINWV